MSYEPFVTAEVAAKIDAQPGPVALFIKRQIIAIADSPTALSIPSYFPYVPASQIVECDYDHAGDRYYIIILFRYADDERTIRVFGVNVFVLPAQ
jgi:hypothetical protein